MDEPGCIDVDCDTVAERIVEDEVPFVSYWYEEAYEERFRTNLLEILNESDPEGWNMLCMWTLPWQYTAMVYPEVGDCECSGPDSDFLVTTSGPAETESERLCGDVNCDRKVNMGDYTLLLNHVGHPTNPAYDLDCCP